MGTGLKFAKFALLAALIVLMVVPALCREKNETIDATAWGESTQMGQRYNITLIIYEWSTPEDRQVLQEAFDKGQNQGLVNALTKMKAVGHISITGTLGYDVSYIKMEPTPTGRRISFVTNRKITFGEAFRDSQTQAFNLSGGIIEVNDKDKSKSAGQIFPAAQLIINKEGKLQLDLNQNAWRLSDIIDWKGSAEN